MIVRGIFTGMIYASAVGRVEINKDAFLADPDGATWKEIVQSDSGLVWDYESADVGMMTWAGLDGIEVWDSEFGDWVPARDWLDDHCEEESE